MRNSVGASLAILLGLLVGACAAERDATTTSVVPVAATGSPSSTSTVAATVATTPPSPTTTTPTTTAPTTTAPTTTTVHAPPLPGLIARLPIPAGGTIERVVVADGTVLASGSTEDSTSDAGRPMLWYSADLETWAETSVIDLYPGQDPWTVPLVTDVVIFDGHLLAFLMGDEDATGDIPPFLISTDGVTWHREDPTAAAGLLAVAYTPDSPPYPGSAAATDALVYDGHLYVTGWVPTVEGSSAALWSTADTANWDLARLPNVAFPNEWGQRLSVGDRGYLVSLGGPVYSGAGVLYSADGADWSKVDEVEEWAAGAVSQNAAGLTILRFDIFGDGTADLLVSDGGDWVPSKPVPASEAVNSIGSGPSWDPLVFSPWSSAELWAYDRGTWVEVEVPGLDRLLDATEEHLIGVAGDELVILDRASVGGG